MRVPEELFAEYLKAHDIDFPDLDAAIPECAKNLRRNEYRSARALLQKHRSGRYSEWIEPLLAMDAVKQRKSTQDPRDFEATGTMGHSDLGACFSAHDPITQAFDEEATGMNECSHAPTWIATFNPADKTDVRRILDRVEGSFKSIAKLSNSAKCSKHGGNPLETHVNLSSTAASSCVRLYLSIAATAPEGARRHVVRDQTFREGRRQGRTLTPARFPIGESDIFTLIEQLRGAVPSEFLPENILMRTQETIMWWTRPPRAHVLRGR